MNLSNTRPGWRACLSYLLLAAMIMGVSPILTSCHDDEPATDAPVSPDGTAGRTVAFSLPDSHYPFTAATTRVAVSLISQDGHTQVFEASVEKEDGMLHFSMHIPEGTVVADGKYIMTLRNANGQTIPGRLSCLFEKESLASVEIILPKYMLDGSGTEEDPYIIADDDDFEMFLINLSDDTESFGAGLKFLQTGDVAAPDQSSLIPGRGYWGSPFAGIYDGGGHAVKSLFYHGGDREDSDSGFGLFQKLLGSATVQNLTLSGASVTGLYKESGLIAGRVSGDVAMSNISLSGYIEGGSSIGCLAGILVEGTLRMEEIHLGATVKGKTGVGGLVGKTDAGTELVASGITADHFSVEGRSHVGGIAGEIAGSASFKDIRIDHKVSNEDSDIRIVAGDGDGVGGVVGSIANTSKAVDFSQCYVLCPIGGKNADAVGALAGVVNGMDVNVSDCRSYSVVAGHSYIGGLFGKVEMSKLGKGLTLTGEDHSTRIAVDDADASVSGENYVGGFAGWWDGQLSIGPKIKINVPVTASATGVGGAFGGIFESAVDATRFLIGPGSSADNTLHISGNTEAGGFVGRLMRSTLTSDSGFDFPVSGDNASVPEADRFSPAFDGVVTGTRAVGGIAGYAKDATIKGVCSAAHVTGSDEVGGVVGKVEDETLTVSNVEDCSFKGILSCSAADKVGGIVGHYRSVGVGYVRDCINYSDIEGGDADGGTAGIVGYVSKAKPNDESRTLQIKWCANEGKVKGNRHVGGIVGKSQAEDSYTVLDGPNGSVAVSIEDCVNKGSVYAEGGSSSGAGVGGVLGFSNYLTGVFRCANHGAVYGHGACHGIGGIAGSMGEDPKGAGLTTLYRNVLLQQCFNKGSVDAGDRSSYVGGILGYMEEGTQSNLDDCCNHGNILPDQSHDCGGILGCADHLTYIYRCVNSGKVYHGNATIGTHKSGSIFYHDYLYYLEDTGSGWPSAEKMTPNEFTIKANFQGFDFTNVWKMTPDGPMLSKNRWNY